MRTKHFSGFLMALLLMTAIANAQTWEKVYEEELGISWAMTVCQTKDSGFVVSGLTWKQSGNGDLYIAKINPEGEMLWYKIYPRSDQTSGKSIKETPEGDLVILANDLSDPNYPHFWLLKTNEYGDTLWTKTFGDKVDAYCLDICPDSGYILAGAKWISGRPDDGYIIKTDKNGDLIWEKILTLNNGTLDGTIRSIKAERDGYIMITSGWQLIKLDENGEFVWQKDYKTTSWGYGMYVSLTDDNGYIFCGVKGSWVNNIFSSAATVIRTDKNGDKIWEKNYSDTDNLSLSTSAIWQKNNGYILVGDKELNTSSNSPLEILLYQLDETGEIVWQKTFPGPHNDCSASDAIPTFDKGVIMVGATLPDRLVRTYVLKVDENGNVGIKGNKTIISDYSLAQNYPNPFNSSTTIQFNLSQDSEVELVVYNLLGEKIATLVKEKKNAGHYTTIWKPENIPSGVYFYVLKTNDKVFAEKMVLIK